MIASTTLDLVNAVSTGLAAIGGIGGTIAAVWAVRVSRESIVGAERSARIATTFAHINDVEERIRALRMIDAQLGYTLLLELSRANQPLTAEAAAVESFVNRLELLAFAILRGDVDRDLAMRFFANIDARRMRDYVRALRECCGGNAHLYENLEKHLESLLADASTAPPKPQPHRSDAIEPRLEKAALPAAATTAAPSASNARARREVERPDSDAAAAGTDENSDVSGRQR